MRPLAPTLVLLSVLAACGGSDDAGSSAAASSSDAGACAADSRKDVYAAGLAKAAGALTVTLVESTPGPPEVGTNVLDFAISDAAGPVDGATVTVAPLMPDHGHGSSVKPTVTARGGGRYHVENVYLVMAGLWRLTVSVQRAAGVVDAAVFQFCLDG